MALRREASPAAPRRVREPSRLLIFARIKPTNYPSPRRPPSSLRDKLRPFSRQLRRYLRLACGGRAPQARASPGNPGRERAGRIRACGKCAIPRGKRISLSPRASSPVSEERGYPRSRASSSPPRERPGRFGERRQSASAKNGLHSRRAALLPFLAWAIARASRFCPRVPLNASRPIARGRAPLPRGCAYLSRDIFLRFLFCKDSS